MQHLGKEKLDNLKKDCERVAEKAKKTVMDLCLLGQELKRIKDTGTWKEVSYYKDETLRTFQYDSFENFSKYVFGFSQTRTSDLLRIAQFIDTKSEEPKFIE